MNVNLFLIILTISLLSGCSGSDRKGSSLPPTMPGDEYSGASFELTAATITYDTRIDSLIFSLDVEDDAASVVPVAAGSVDGAPVLAYVFTTSLSPATVGFGDVQGTLALAVTSHPDFDDTPFWDEDNNAVFDDDGVVYHSHWVVLESNDLAGEGLAVVQARKDSTLPPTAPMPMYLDSPGFDVIENDNTLKVIVPFNRVKRDRTFTATALTAYLEVEAQESGPLLKVEQIYSTLSADGEQSLIVDNVSNAADNALPGLSTDELPGTFAINEASVDYFDDLQSHVFSMTTDSNIAASMPVGIGQVDGAPVFGYVFPTDLTPSAVGFKDIDGILALALTSHPDFDDTPLWDEDMDDDYANDGKIYHTHWVVLVDDASSAAGLSVPSQPDTTKLPPTAPMPMYLDSPGFHAFAQDQSLYIVVPKQRINNITQFNFDAVTAKMNVDASSGTPVLRVNEVLSIWSNDLSLPGTVTLR